MKKLSKFIFGTVSLATLACGAYYVYKNLINKDTSDEFDDFEDEFEDFEDEDYDDNVIPKDTREYVSINITSDNDDDAANVEEESELESDETLIQNEEELEELE